METYFTVFALAGGGYFALARRRFDFLSLAYVSALVYFLPAFLGYARMPKTVFSDQREAVSLAPQTYWVYFLVLGVLAATAALSDRLPPLRVTWRPLPAPRIALVVLLLLASLGLAATVVLHGTLLLSTEKHLIVAGVGRWRLLWVNGAALCAVLAFCLRRWWVLGMALGMLLADLFVGFRNNLALATIALFVLWLDSGGRQRLVLSQLRAAVLGAAAAASFFLYKVLYIPIKQANWDEVVYRLTSSQYLQLTLSFSEPFLNQAILNEVLRRSYVVGADGASGIVYSLLLFSPSLGAESVSFGDRIREDLFPGTPGGIGSNIWAEMWSRGGWPLLILFTLAFALSLVAASRLLRLGDPLVSSLVALNGSYWAFYIHRNTLAYQLNLHKRLVVIWLVAAVATLVVASLGAAVRRDAPPP